MTTPERKPSTPERPERIDWSQYHQNTNTEKQQRLAIIKDALIAMYDMYAPKSSPSAEDLARKARVFNHALHDIPQDQLKRCFWEASKKGKFPGVADVIAIYMGERKIQRPKVGCPLCEESGSVGLRRVIDMRQKPGDILSFICECAIGKMYGHGHRFPMELPMGMIPWSKEAEKEFYSQSREFFETTKTKEG